MRFAYYPGCTANGSTPEVTQATRKLADRLGIELVELTEAGCCGSCEVRPINPELHRLLNARILTLAQNQGLELLTICDTCQFNLKQTQKEIASSAKSLEDLNAKLQEIGLRFAGKTLSRHLLEVLSQEIGLDGLRKRVVRPLRGLRVAPFACCHVFRGEGGTAQSKDFLSDILAICGAEVVATRDYSHCCGFHVLMLNEDLAARAAGQFLGACKSDGVDCVVTSSPLCHIALDIYQTAAERAVGQQLGIPVFHFEQLVALSLGVPASELGINQHMVSAEAALGKVPESRRVPLR